MSPDGPERSDWFCGRSDEVATIRSWFMAASPGLYVLLGSAGTGKSALLDRVTSTCRPAALVHPRKLTVGEVAEVLGAQLARSGVLPNGGDGHHTVPHGLFAALRIAAATPGWRTPTIVVDGLDEAGPDAIAVAKHGIARLARWASVIVATRPVGRTVDHSPLVGALGPRVALLDLDEPAVAASGRRAIRSVVADGLAGRSAAMDAERVADEFLARVEDGRDAPFILARLIVDRLLVDPVDTSAPGWEGHIDVSLDRVMVRDVATLPPPAHPGDAVAPTLRARVLLEALTWSYGRGFPEAEWLCVASALRLGITMNRDDIAWLLNTLGRYVTEDVGERGEPVYRPVHHSVAEIVRPPFVALGDAAFDPSASSVTRALLERYAALHTEGRSPMRDSYLERYAWRHAAAAGLLGLAQLRTIATRELRVDGDVGQAARRISDRLGVLGAHDAALPPAIEAVTIYRRLAAHGPDYVPELAVSLHNLGARYGHLGRPSDALPPLDEAAGVYLRLANENPAYFSHVALALTNIGMQYGALGRLTDSLPLLDKVVGLRRHLAAENPALRGDLADALSNHAARLGQLHMPAAGLPLLDEAILIYRELDPDDPDVRSGLARALLNVAGLYGALNRPADALAPLDDAATTLRPVATEENPAIRRQLASALVNLGVFHHRTGQLHHAVGTTHEAVMILRRVAGGDRVTLRHLAAALTNLAHYHQQLGQRTEVAPLHREAAGIRRSLDLNRR